MAHPNLIIIEVNDREFRIAKGSEIVHRSPGYLLLEAGDKVTVGTAAMSKSRLHPRQIHNRFWRHLNQDPLPRATKRFRHHADLAYAHVMAIYEEAGQPDEVLFAVPASFSNEQLSLLLGIAEACPFAVLGLIDSAVASTAGVAGAGHFQHIDMHLHHTVITQLEVGETVSRRSVEVIDGAGFTDIYDICRTLIADSFIQSTRFDPLRQAESEQALQDQLPTWLQTLATQDDVVMDVTHRGSRYQGKLSTEAVLNAAQPIYQKILDRLNSGATCLVGERVTHLPGLIARLPNYDIVPPESIFTACLQHVAQIRSDGPMHAFVTELPATDTPTFHAKQAARIAAPRPRQPSSSGATHVLWQSQAYPLTEHPLYLAVNGISGAKPVALTRCSLHLNGSEVVVNPEKPNSVMVNGLPLTEPSVVNAGDIITLYDADVLYRLIVVPNG